MNCNSFIKLSKKDLAILRKIELDILMNVISAINELHLNYFAVGGTALGAYKYSGFIPWDDDIDIAMPRKDFETFIKKAESVLPSHLKIQSVYNDTNYTLGVAKIRDERTTFFDAYTSKYNISHGVFIDIFPIDYCGKHNPTDRLLYKIRENKIAFSNDFKPQNLSFKNKVTSVLCKLLLLFESPHKCALKNDMYLAKLNLKNENSSKVFMRIEKHESEFFTKNNKLLFESMEIVVPNNLEIYLKNCYGDISIEPPIEKQYPHHHVILFDPNRSYKDYCYKDGKVALKQ